MNIKTLLLGSAAVFSVAGAAQAADTVKPAPAQVVKPVQYVQICDAYGLGYFTIPGQATCLRVQGQIQFQVNFHTRDTEFWSPSTTSWHEAGWDSQAQAKLTFTAKRMTDHGDLTGVVQLTGTSYNGGNIQAETFGGSTGRVPVSQYVQVTLAYIRLGGFEVGYDNSVYGIGVTRQASYTWNFGSTAVALGIDDPMSRWGSRLPRYANVPDIVGDISGSASWGTWGFGAGVNPDVGGFAGASTGKSSADLGGYGPQHLVWGINAKATINTPAIAKGDQLSFSGSLGTGCAFVVNNCGNGTTNGSGLSFGQNGAGGPPPAVQTIASTNGTPDLMWQAMASFKHVFDPSLNSTVSFLWIGEPGPVLPGKLTAQWQAKDSFVWQGISDKNYQISTFVAAQQSVGQTSHGGVVWSGQVQFVWSY